MNYKIHQGSLAFMLHRLTGVMLIGYLIVHIMALTGLNDPITWHEKMQLFTTPVFTFVEYLLFLPILFHSLNGIRLIIVEWTDNGSKNHKKMLAAVYTVSVILALAMGLIFMQHGDYENANVEKYNQKFQQNVEWSGSASCHKEVAKKCTKSAAECAEILATCTKDTAKCSDCTAEKKCDKCISKAKKCPDCKDDKKCKKCKKCAKDKGDN